MERTRAVSPASSNESALPELAAQEPAPKALPLRERVEAVRSPGVMREDVEALLAGLSAPLAEGESPRERADQLLHLLEDEVLGELTDQEGRQVRPEALEALLALGYPYALEVPPEVLSRMNRAGSRALSRSALWGLGLAAFAAVLPTVMVALTSERDVWHYIDVLAIIAGASFLPATLSAVAERYRLPWLKYLGNSGLVLLSAASLVLWWVLSSRESLQGSLTSLGVGLALLGSVFCLRRREELEDPDT